MALFETENLFALKKKATAHSTLRFSIRSASSLLKNETFQTLLTTLAELLPSQLYQDLYLPAIEQLVNYVQGLPARKQGLFSEISGLLDYSLSRAVYTLTFCLAHFYPDKKDFHQLKIDGRESLKLYAAFTAALFLNIDQLISDYEVILYDAEEKPLKLWRPFEGAMQTEKNAVFYSFQYIHNAAAYRLSRGCLASVILMAHENTRKGFHWIAQQGEILEAWLATIDEEIDRMPLNEVMELIPFADKQAIDERLQFLKTMTSRSRGLFYDGQFNNESDFSFNRALGEQFLRWLREGISTGRFAINATEETGLRRIREGVLIARSELIKFSQLHQVNPDVVEQQFQEIVALYPSSVNERARQSSSMGGMASVALGQWLLVYNPALIFSLGRVPPFFSAKQLSGAIPSMDLTHPIGR